MPPEEDPLACERAAGNSKSYSKSKKGLDKCANPGTNVMVQMSINRATAKELSALEIWQCDDCGWVWFSRVKGKKPGRCPSRECRKLDGKHQSANENSSPIQRKAPSTPDAGGVGGDVESRAASCRRCDSALEAQGRNWYCNVCRRQYGELEVKWT